MSDSEKPSSPSIAEHLMLSRLMQAEQTREFFIQMWLQNPTLAKRAGKRIQALLSPLADAANTG